MQLLQQTLKISSLELVEQINIFRKQEREIYNEEKNRLYADITHDSLLKIIRDEFEEEISLGEVKHTSYIHLQNGQSYPMYILTRDQAIHIMERIKFRNRVKKGLQEETALKTIEQILGITLIRQFKVGKYLIDGYDPETNTAYEIDEPHHKSKLVKDKLRQEFIENELKCTFKRIKL